MTSSIARGPDLSTSKTVSLRNYRVYVSIVDAVVVVWAAIGALILRFGGVENAGPGPAGQPYIAFTVVLAGAWWILLGMLGARDNRVFGHGPEEFKRVLSSSFWLFGLVGLTSYALQLEIARGYVAVALPAGLVSLLVARYALRLHLKLRRQSGRDMESILLLGSKASVEHLARVFQMQPNAGYKPIGTYLIGVPDDVTVDPSMKLPNYGHEPSLSAILRAIKLVEPQAVALSSGVLLPPKTIRELGWALADARIALIMAPALTDIAGPRIHTQPLAGLPLIHVSTPNLRRGERIAKRAFDIMSSFALLIITSPLTICTAIAIRLDSGGPVLFRQERIGARGEPFQMLKFRSMRIDAEAELKRLVEQSDGNSIMFKMKVDPRVTRVGKTIRRYSIDELPQLVNVLQGKMSLVGPRPPLPQEVDAYEPHVHRRLLVRPGLTGLWQVSGRSLLSWEDTVRLDLYYVENWSLAGDIAILLKTVRAVLARHGAY